MEVALGCVYIPELCFYTRILVSFYLALNDSFRAFSFGGNDMNDAEYMRLALALAEQGRGWTAPNPMVGAVIVKDGAVIGQGWHERYGEPHAERNALAACTADPAGATMYVTLEPCCHYGKQPPCVNAIIEHKISRVYVGSDDPNALVSGKGYQILRDAGIEVITHVLKEECDSLNPVFFHYIVNKTPYVVMKYAMTMDGKIATYSGKSKWITGEEARAHVMEQRNALTGIMVGSETVIKDDPALTCRRAGGRNPVRIICDSRLRIPMDSQIVRTASEVPTILATIQSEDQTDKKQKLIGAGVEIIETENVDGHVDLQELMRQLGARNIDGILLEGGGTLNESALKAGIVKEVDVYIAPKIFGGSAGYTPVGGMGVESPEEAYPFELGSVQRFGADIMLQYFQITA